MGSVVSFEGHLAGSVHRGQDAKRLPEPPEGQGVISSLADNSGSASDP